MRMSLKRLMTPAVVLPLLWPFGTLLADSSTALAAITGPRVQNPSPRVVTRWADLGRILAVLEIKMGGHTLPAKVKDKLSTLTDGQIRLIASLSDRIADEGHTPSADIAFLLIAALIILS
jgi:hypothetical protein